MPPASPRPRSADQLPQPLPLSPEGQRTFKAQYKHGQHKYVGQRVRVWREEEQAWREGTITSFGQNKHKVECDDKARFAFSMATDAFQLLPSPGAAAHPSPVMPLAGIPLGAAGIPAPPPFVPLPAGAEAAAAAWDGAAGAAVGSRRLAHLPPLEAPPPKKPAKTTQGPPVLPPEALPIARDRLQAEFSLPPCTQLFQSDRVARVLRLILGKLKEFPGQWVPKSAIRQTLHNAGIRAAIPRDNALMDYCGKALECTILDGWAVYRNRSPQYNCLYYLAEKVGDDSVLTIIPEVPRADSLKRPRPPPSKQAAPPPPLYSAALNRPRRVLGGNFRRGGGALSPRTTISSAAAGPHRQQPWQMLLPGGAPVGALTPEHCRHQVMADLVYLFNQVLRQYKPATFLSAQQAARAAAAAAGGEQQAPLRTLRLDKLLGEVQVLRDCKHFVKVGSGARLGELPSPPGTLRLLCHLELGEAPAVDAAGESEPSWAPPTRPPPEVLLLPADATVGQLLEAATAAFRAAYRMCANWTAEAVVGGLSLAVPAPTQQAAAVPALPAPAATYTAGQQPGDGAAPMEVDGADPSSPEAVAAATAAAAVSAAVAGTDGPAAKGAAPAPAAPVAAAGDEEERLAAALSAAAISAVAAAHDGPPAGGEPQQAQQGPAEPQQQPAQQQVAQQAQHGAQQAQQDVDRQALLARRLADLLLPPQQQQQQQQQDGSEPAAAGAGGSAEVAREAASNSVQLAAVTVAGRGIDWAVRWRHAGGLEDWEVSCRCGVRDDDGERMIMCDACNIWMHTRCYHIPDDHPVPDAFMCDACTKRHKAEGHPEGHPEGRP